MFEQQEPCTNISPSMINAVLKECNDEINQYTLLITRECFMMKTLPLLRNIIPQKIVDNKFVPGISESSLSFENMKLLIVIWRIMRYRLLHMAYILNTTGTKEEYIEMIEFIANLSNHIMETREHSVFLKQINVYEDVIIHAIIACKDDTSLPSMDFLSERISHKLDEFFDRTIVKIDDMPDDDLTTKSVNMYVEMLKTYNIDTSGGSDDDTDDESEEDSCKHVTLEDIDNQVMNLEKDFIYVNKKRDETPDNKQNALKQDVVVELSNKFKALRTSNKSVDMKNILQSIKVNKEISDINSAEKFDKPEYDNIDDWKVDHNSFKNAIMMNSSSIMDAIKNFGNKCYPVHVPLLMKTLASDYYKDTDVTTSYDLISAQTAIYGVLIDELQRICRDIKDEKFAQIIGLLVGELGVNLNNKTQDLDENTVQKNKNAKYCVLLNNGILDIIMVLIMILQWINKKPLKPEVCAIIGNTDNRKKAREVMGLTKYSQDVYAFTQVNQDVVVPENVVKDCYKFNSG